MVTQQVSFVERLSLSRRYILARCRNSVLCREVVPISEGPLSEVPLYLLSLPYSISTDALCRDDPSEISRDPRTKCLQTLRESLARPSKHTDNNF